MSDRTPLPQLAAKLLELTGEPGPGYQYVHRLITAGRLPVVYEFGRYFFRDEDLPRVAALLGLRLKDPACRDPAAAIRPPRGRPPSRAAASAPLPVAAPRAVAPKQSSAAPERPRAAQWNAGAWKNFIKAHDREPASLDEFTAWRERAAGPRSATA